MISSLPKTNLSVVGTLNFLFANAFDFDKAKLLFKVNVVHNSCITFDFLAHLSTTCSRGAFRDGPVSVVRHPSCIIRHAPCAVNNCFKHLLLPNRWANLDQTWQECSLGGPL